MLKIKKQNMVLIRKINNNIVVASNDDLIIYNTENGGDLYLKIPEPNLPENLTKGQIQVLKGEAKNIISIEFSKSGDYAAVATENKQVIVYNKAFEIVRNFIVNRAASKVCFTDSNDILVADKTGDVYLYKLDADHPPTLLLGHLSVILDVAISECGKYIITCDRDEKIRVSCFPNCYNIVSFCLGHKEFVTKVKLVKNILISASGDGTIRFWDFIRGKQLEIINTNEYIDEDNLLKVFSEQMDKEKVDVTALPINDMQTYERNVLYIAVSIYNYDNVQLYNADLQTFKFNYIAKINVNSSFTFFLSDHLYVLSNKLQIFNLTDDNIVHVEEPLIDKFYEKYKSKLELDEDTTITVLYKRKFDNVKEYLERKKQRLEGK